MSRWASEEEGGGRREGGRGGGDSLAPSLLVLGALLPPPCLDVRQKEAAEPPGNKMKQENIEELSMQNRRTLPKFALKYPIFRRIEGLSLNAT